MEDLHNFAFSQWLKTSYLNKKHVFEGEDKRKIDYSQSCSVAVDGISNYYELNLIEKHDYIGSRKILKKN